MESGAGARVETANPSEKSSIARDNPYFAGTALPSSEERGQLASCPYEGVNLLPPLRFDYRGGRGHENGYGNDMEMKIMIFPVKFDKFTGFFDKLLKNNVQINDCNQKGYHTNLSAAHSDTAAKKKFWEPAHLPATARICARD